MRGPVYGELLREFCGNRSCTGVRREAVYATGAHDLFNHNNALHFSGRPHNAEVGPASEH